MDEDKLADLNDIQDFFNRSHSTSAFETFLHRVDRYQGLYWLVQQPLQ